MANVKKLQVNVDVQATFEAAIKQAEKFKDVLKDSSLPKNLTKDLERDLTKYYKVLLKVFNFKPNTSNLTQYGNLIGQLENAFNQLNESIDSFGSDINEVFKNPKIDNYKQKIKELKAEIIKLDKETKKYYGITGADPEFKQKQAIKEKEEASKDLSGAAKDATLKKQEEMRKALERRAQAQKELEKTEKLYNQEVENTNKKQKEAQQEINKTKEDFNNLNPVIDDAKVAYSKLAKETASFASQERVQDLTNTLKRWTAFGVAIGYARNQLIQMKETYLELDASLTQIAVVSGKTRDQMWDMIGTYNEMAQRLGATTAQVVESSKLYFQQGRSQSEVMELVEQTTILAAISELDFADATNYLTAAINGFKLEAEDAVNVTDVWANLAAKAAVDTQELAVAISKVASIAKSAGTDIETTSAFLTKMINFATYARVA